MSSPARPSAGVAAVEKPPFHSEGTFTVQQGTVPAGHCGSPLPNGLSYLWMSTISGAASSTHLGVGRLEGTLCVFGALTDPAAPPPGNGTPMGWIVEEEVWIAANGDRLVASGEMVGVTAPPGTPGSKFIEAIRFRDGGTGRFEFAEGEVRSLVDVVTMTFVTDGWIRYGRTR